MLDLAALLSLLGVGGSVLGAGLGTLWDFSVEESIFGVGFWTVWVAGESTFGAGLWVLCVVFVVGSIHVAAFEVESVLGTSIEA